MTDNKPMVTIVTPMYNASKYIMETIQSVLAQTCENWEMIIVDNCSTDDSRDLVNSIDDKRIKLICLEYNSGGPARPRNIGLSEASGNYIAFLDADDVWHDNKLTRQLSVIEDESCDIVHTLAYTMDPASERTGISNNQRIYKLFKFFMKKKSIIYYSNFININTSLMKVDKDITFSEDKPFIAIEDWKFWIDHLNSQKKIVLLDEYLIDYRVDYNSMSARDTDQSYRKVIYLLGYFLQERRIKLVHYISAHFFVTLKIILKNIKLSLKRS